MRKGREPHLRTDVHSQAVASAAPEKAADPRGEPAGQSRATGTSTAKEFHLQMSCRRQTARRAGGGRGGSTLLGAVRLLSLQSSTRSKDATPIPELRPRGPVS